MLPPHGGGGRTYQASYFLLSPISPPAEDVYLIFRAPASFFLTAQVILLQELTLVFIHILDDPPSLFWKMYLLKKICICTCVCVWVCAYSHGTCGGQKEGGVRTPGAGVGTVMIHLLWVLGTEHRSSRRVTSVVNHWAASPAPLLLFTPCNSCNFLQMCLRK